MVRFCCIESFRIQLNTALHCYSAIKHDCTLISGSMRSSKRPATRPWATWPRTRGQWRAEEGAEVRRPRASSRGHPTTDFLKKCIGQCRKVRVNCVKSEERLRAYRIRGASGKMFRKKRERKSRNWEKGIKKVVRIFGR